MLFNSFEFIFIFLPITLVGFFFIGKFGYYRCAIAWLASSSIIFYGWWNPAYVWLILVSMIINYSTGSLLARLNDYKKIVLTVGVLFNLSLLGYYKYTNFLVSNISCLLDSNLEIDHIILPLAISFFTFQQISFLVDAYYGITKEYSVLHYCLFVSFFPQLIAGPIVHHKEIIPQFSNKSIYKFNHDNLSAGITIFAIGLAKKVLVADNLSPYSTSVFDSSELGSVITLFEAWGGALSYTFQLYFDFSGYTDMTLGLARIFGIFLPVNFNSPYKAQNIIEFWRRWHITLSIFLRSYVYIPLGGNRKGVLRRYQNILVTMLLGGIWHGAGWNFLLWGMFHGALMIINHLWRESNLNIKNILQNYACVKHFYHILTFILIVFGWVLFRAESLSGSVGIMKGMVGLNGIVLPAALSSVGFLQVNFIEFGMWLRAFGSSDGLLLVAGSALIAFFGPNSLQIMIKCFTSEYYRKIVIPYKYRGVEWGKGTVSVLCILILLVLCVSEMTKVSEFLYFQF